MSVPAQRINIMERGLIDLTGWGEMKHVMMTLSNGSIFRVTGHLCGEFTGEFPAQRPVTRSVDVFFDLRPNKRLNKQSWGWWFETPSRPLWRHCNDMGRAVGSSSLVQLFACSTSRVHLNQCYTISTRVIVNKKEWTLNKIYWNFIPGVCLFLIKTYGLFR